MRIPSYLMVFLAVSGFNAYSAMAADMADSDASLGQPSVDVGTDGAAIDVSGDQSDGVGIFGDDSSHPPAPHPNPGPHPAPAPAPHPNPGPHPGPGPGPHPHPGPGPHPAPIHHDPVPIHHGGSPWPHWDHPYFPRPSYGFDWDRLVAVTCVAEDSIGDQYPVTEDGYVGFEYQQWLSDIEDDAIDRCYDESGGDDGCMLVGCTPVY